MKEKIAAKPPPQTQFFQGTAQNLNQKKKKLGLAARTGLKVMKELKQKRAAAEQKV